MNVCKWYWSISIKQKPSLERREIRRKWCFFYYRIFSVIFPKQGHDSDLGVYKQITSFMPVTLFQETSTASVFHFNGIYRNVQTKENLPEGQTNKRMKKLRKLFSLPFDLDRCVFFSLPPKMSQAQRNGCFILVQLQSPNRIKLVKQRFCFCFVGSSSWRFTTCLLFLSCLLMILGVSRKKKSKMCTCSASRARSVILWWLPETHTHLTPSVIFSLRDMCYMLKKSRKCTSVTSSWKGNLKRLWCSWCWYQVIQCKRLHVYDKQSVPSQMKGTEYVIHHQTDREGCFYFAFVAHKSVLNVHLFSRVYWRTNST